MSYQTQLNQLLIENALSYEELLEVIAHRERPDPEDTIEYNYDDYYQNDLI